MILTWVRSWEGEVGGGQNEKLKLDEASCNFNWFEFWSQNYYRGHLLYFVGYNIHNTDWLLNWLCCRRWQIHLLVTRLPRGRPPGLPQPGQVQGDGDPLLPRPGRRGEDLQVVPAVAQQVRRQWDHWKYSGFNNKFFCWKFANPPSEFLGPY